jgi:Arc/MetJ family transcription regulator
MKTTIDIDQQLLSKAQKALGTGTIKGTVEASLRSVVRQRQLQELADSLGTIQLELTPESLRAQRRKRAVRVPR